MPDSEVPPEENHPDSFLGSITPLLILGQVCGLLPVKGISGPKLSFSWANGAHAYGFVIFAATLFFDTCYTIDNLKSDIRIDVFASTVFYTVCLLTTFFFLGIAQQLPGISTRFAEIEKQMMDYGYPKSLGFKVKAFLFSFIFLAIVEHGTLVFINLKNAWMSSGAGGEGFGYLFFHMYFPALTTRLSYSGLGTLILFWVNAMCTFNWNYLDFFLIVISLETYSRFSQINTRIQNADLQNESRVFWDKTIRDYNRLSLLTKHLDKMLSKVILTSFFSNMYHLSLQLVRSLKISGTIFQMTYFYFSLTYLIVRLLLVLFVAAKINDESKKPSVALFALEKPSPEALRLLHQVQTDDIALTGNRFFVIDQKFVASGLDRIVFRELIHNAFDLVTEESLIDRIFCAFDKNNDGVIKLDNWICGLSTFLRGTLEERAAFCFSVYDTNSDGFITRDEMMNLLRNSLMKSPQDEDPEEGVRDLVELALRKIDVDKDGKISYKDFLEAVTLEPLLLEAFGQCLPTEAACQTFISTLKS